MRKDLGGCRSAWSECLELRFLLLQLPQQPVERRTSFANQHVTRQHLDLPINLAEACVGVCSFPACIFGDTPNLCLKLGYEQLC